MRHNAIVGNVGHFDTEVDVAGLAAIPGIEKVGDQATGTRVAVPRRALGHRAVRGPAAQPGQRHGPSQLRDVELVQATRSWRRSSCTPSPGSTATRVYTLPKHLDEEVARLHLDALGAHLTTLTKVQAEYLGIDVEGPYKADHYRY